MSFASLDDVIARASQKWRPPPRLTLSQWSDANFMLSAESAAVPGRWKTLPYQRAIMDAMSDPTVEEVSLLKSARIGYTLMMSALIGYFMDAEPSSMLVVQPTVDDAKGYSKETIAPMIRDVPVLANLMMTDVDDPEEQRIGQRARRRKRRGPKDKSDTIRHKAFPGGVLSLVGANSGAGFRRISRRVVIFDEIDAYPASAGVEGDPLSLGAKRTEAFHNRKLINGSTPLEESTSRIKRKFEAGDRQYLFVPCPQCGHMDFLSPRERADGRAHFMRWPEGKPEAAFFVCAANGCVIEHKDKRWMVERGEWRADKPGGRHRSFYIWSAYSYAPNSTWGHIAGRFVAAQKSGDVEQLKTVINTDFAETWVEKGEAPEWERIYERREHYPIGTCPAPVLAITAGVDVQKDRFVVEIVGWTETLESYSIDAFEIYGDTAERATWDKLDKVLARSYQTPKGPMPIAGMGVDSGYSAQNVYAWCRLKPANRVFAMKGMDKARTLVGAPSRVDVTIKGKTLARGARLWPVLGDIAKSELYGFLRLRIAAGEPPPPGYCHFPEYGEEYFRQLTAEHLIVVHARKGGRSKMRWEQLPNRENHFLDARVYARAAAYILGLDRAVARAHVRDSAAEPDHELPPPPQGPSSAASAQADPAPALAAPAPQEPASAPPPRRQGSIWGGRTGHGAGRSIWGRRGR